jgi:hypothetical protein
MNLATKRVTADSTVPCIPNIEGNMINSGTSCGVETTSNRANMTDYRFDLTAIVHQIRLCRSTLGAILDELECGGQNQDTLDGIGEVSLNLSAEIESLWSTVKRSS